MNRPIALFLMLLALPSPAQMPPAFEVASIKINRSGGMNSGFRRAGAGELNAINITLKRLIAFAYSVQDFQIVGGPDWIDSERYDILAKPAAAAQSEPAADRNSLMRQRLQALLADRFQLSFHRTSKEMPGLVLLVGKKGSKLTPTRQSEPELLSNGHHLTCQKVSMHFFTEVFLQGETHKPVIDHTELQGEFDFTLDWAPDEPSRRPNADPGAAASPSDAPSLFTALQEQLGLKLEADKAPVEILSIDRAEHPSSN